jgi:integrase
MATFKFKEDSCIAIVRRKEGKEVIFAQQRTFTGMPKAEKLARDWARRLEEALDRDGVPTRKAQAVTLGALLARHRESSGTTKPLTRSRYSQFNRLAEEFATLPLGKMTPYHFTQFAQRRREGGASPSTVLSNLSTIRTTLGVAKVMYGLDVDASSVAEAIKTLMKMGVVAKGNKRTRRPTDAELALLEQDFKDQKQHKDSTLPMSEIMWLAIELPRRVGELCDMRWDDYVDRVVTLRDTKHPTKPRIEEVPVLAGAAAIIKLLPRLEERILPYNSESVGAAWRRACKRQKIVDLHFHDLRREGVSRLFKRGFSIPEVSKISGHLDWDMLQIYTELRPRDIVEKFE